MSTIAFMIATVAACGLPMLYLHAQLTKARTSLRLAEFDRDRYKRSAEQARSDAYALTQALSAREPEPYRHRLAQPIPTRSWGPS